MRHLVDHRKLGRTQSHRKALLRNLVTSLLLHERIETTLPKAKELRSLADRMITWGKQGDLAARRQAARVVQSPEALRRLFDGLAKRFEKRPGGYTRIIPLGHRLGDSASMAIIEYLGYELPSQEKKESPKDKKVKQEKKEKGEKKKVTAKKAQPIRKKEKEEEKVAEKRGGTKKKDWRFWKRGSRKD